LDENSLVVQVREQCAKTQEEMFRLSGYAGGWNLYFLETGPKD
jgi:hypothetical protein